MKELSKLKIILRNNIKNVLNERELLSKLDHPFLIKMNFSFQDKDNLYFVLDYKDRSDLRYYYYKNIQFNEEQSKFIISCLILSLEYIHTNKIIHRDLKPENLIFDSKGYLYLTDFGIARKIENNKEIEMDGGGSAGYISPEMIFRQRYSFTADYFAVGIILYELMLLSRPYYGSRKEIKQQFKEEEIQINKEEIPQGWSNEAGDLINKLILINPEKRLGNKGIFEIKNHPWFKYYDWKGLYLKNIISPLIPSLIAFNFEKEEIEDDLEISNYPDKYNIMLNSADFNYKFDGFLYFNRYEKRMLNNENEYENPHQIYEDIYIKEKKFFDELQKKEKEEKKIKKRGHKKLFSAELIVNNKNLLPKLVVSNNEILQNDNNKKIIKVNRINKFTKKINNSEQKKQFIDNKKIIEVNRKKIFAN